MKTIHEWERVYVGKNSEQVRYRWAISISVILCITHLIPTLTTTLTSDSRAVFETK